jgi:hypothetical protein
MRDRFHGSAHPGQVPQNAHRVYSAIPARPTATANSVARPAAGATQGTLISHGDNAPPTPCQQNPADWCDPKRRVLTRQQCLQCPQRRDCARSTLRSKPTYGMWAGIWINDDFTSKQHLLLLDPPIPPVTEPTEHATDTPAPVTRAPRPSGTRRIRVGTLLPVTPPPAIAALITARASGHCEIMAPACTYQQAAIFSRRRRSVTLRDLASPADGIAACHNCIDLIEHTDIPTAMDLGYLVDPRCTTSTTTMLWRQHRWVYLDTRGHIHDINDPALTHSAS